MWEFCVMANDCDKNVITYIQEKSQKVVAECGGVSCFDENGKEVSFSVGVKKEKSAYLKQKLTKILCDAICEKMKYNYLKNHIMVEVKDESMLEAFIKVYTYFDMELEKAIAIRMIYFPKVLNINSFLNFNLPTLKQKWQEMCNLTNMNSALFVKSATFLDLLKFLIANLDYKYEKIVVDFSTGIIFCEQDKKGLKICDFETNNVVDVLTKVIELSPKHIKIKSLYNNEIKDVMLELFQNRVEIQKN